MSLVGYDDTSSEDEEKVSSMKTEVSQRKKGSGFAPGPLKVLPKTKNGTTRITAPSLSDLDFEDSDDEDSNRGAEKLKDSYVGERKSGLLMKLPAPMNAARSKEMADAKFMPYVLTNKKRKNPGDENTTETESKKGMREDSSSVHTHVPSIAELKKRSAQAARDLLSAKKSRPIQDDANDADSTKDDEFAEVGFFSFSDKVQEVRSLDQAVESTIGIDIKPDVIDTLHSGSTPDPVSDEPSIRGTTYSTQDDREFLRLQGKRNRNENVNFIEIHQDDALEGGKEMLLKQISEEKDLQRMSSKNRNVTGGAMKRKHQLPYLIEQAKAREIELKNTWAQNRLSKQQTQSKYGW